MVIRVGGVVYKKMDMVWKYLYYYEYDLVICKIEGDLCKNNLSAYFKILKSILTQYNSKRVIINLKNCNFKCSLLEIIENSEILKGSYFTQDKIEVYYISTDPKQTTYLALTNNKFENTNIQFKVCSTMEKPFTDCSMSLETEEIEQIFNIL